MDKNRRRFIKRSMLGAAGIFTTSMLNTTRIWGQVSSDSKLPAILGGPKAHIDMWPAWPVWESSYNERLLRVLESGVWSREKVLKTRKNVDSRGLMSLPCREGLPYVNLF